VSDPACVASRETPTATLVASYDVLRQIALGRNGPDEGPSLGFTVLLRQGMAAWLRAWAMCPPPAAPLPRPAQLPAIPHLVHIELARVWAHMALSHQEAAWI
jgi:hypothetical protein